MVHITELLQEQDKKIQELNKLRLKAVDEKKQKEENEADLWVTTNFKEKGLTNEKMRQAYVVNQMALLYPNFYNQTKAKITNLEHEIRCLRQVIDVMINFGVEEIEFPKKKEEDKDKRDGSQTTV